MLLAPKLGKHLQYVTAPEKTEKPYLQFILIFSYSLAIA